jgi:hypothetical protein
MRGFRDSAYPPVRASLDVRTMTRPLVPACPCLRLSASPPSPCPRVSVSTCLRIQTGTPFQGIMAMGLTQPALAALILIGKHATLNP